jgi:hypothetical protein
MPSHRNATRLRRLGALMLLVIAGVHFQQYVDFMSEVPTVGVLFLVNAAGGVGLLLALRSSDRLISLLAMIGSIGLAAGSLVSVGIALNGSFFSYSEPTLRLPIGIAIAAEVLLVVALVPPLLRNILKAS